MSLNITALTRSQLSMLRYLSEACPARGEDACPEIAAEGHTRCVGWTWIAYDKWRRLRDLAEAGLLRRSEDRHNPYNYAHITQAGRRALHSQEITLSVRVSLHAFAALVAAGDAMRPGEEALATKRAADALALLAQHAHTGVVRPGAWEREWLEKVFGGVDHRLAPDTGCSWRQVPLCAGRVDGSPCEALPAPDGAFCASCRPRKGRS